MQAGSLRVAEVQPDGGVAFISYKARQFNSRSLKNSFEFMVSSRFWVEGTPPKLEGHPSAPLNPQASHEPHVGIFAEAAEDQGCPKILR